jgi:hypothetical protein
MRNAVSSVMFVASLANSHTCVEMLEAAFTAVGEAEDGGCFAVRRCP